MSASNARRPRIQAYPKKRCDGDRAKHAISIAVLIMAFALCSVVPRLRTLTLAALVERASRKAGFSLRELFDGRGTGSRSKVAVKYRDDAGNTWTGRGRMPRWLTAATKGGKAKKEDFLIA